jgi:multidrug resistance efflux pump
MALLLLVAWAYWAIRVPISLFEVTTQARLEIQSATYPIQSPDGGRVVSAYLDRGRQVQQGDVLVELEAEPEKFALKELAARIAAVPPEIEKLREQIYAEESARDVERNSSRSAIAEAAEKIQEAEEAARYAASDFTSRGELSREGLVSRHDLAQAESEALRLRALSLSTRAAAQRLPEEQKTRDGERSVRIKKIAADIAHLEGSKREAEAALQSSRYRLEQRVIRAPVAGRIGESATIQPGAVITVGQILGSIVPLGGLRIVAQFAPSQALGRLQSGQPAQMRLDGYPWTEFGTIQARVARVADEIRDGTVRVDLMVLDSPGLRVPLKHGMPGSIEVLVERIPAVSLLLRAAGRSVGTPLNIQPGGSR